MFSINNNTGHIQRLCNIANHSREFYPNFFQVIYNPGSNVILSDKLIIEALWHDEIRIMLESS